jgi:enoyl-CoA hydratase
MFEEVLVRDDAFVRVLTINRPARANALSRAVRRALATAILAAEDLDTTRVTVITGSGDRVFCAGADLKEIAEDDAAGKEFIPPNSAGQRSLYEVMLDCTKPLIAAINGHAVAGGLELALACDLRVASETAQLGMPEATRGMGANFGSVVLPRLVPMAVALEMLLTGRSISAVDAARWGLVNAVVPPSDVLPVAVGLAETIAANAPLSVRRMKAAATRGSSLPIAAALRMDIGPNPYTSEDRKEGIRAFAERRPPEWQGR